MKLKVTPGRLYSENSMITFSEFETLTGKRLVWEDRQGKTIHVEREKGHIHLYDEQFIPGRTYKLIHKHYVCAHVSDDGYALLTPQSGTALTTITSNNPKNWEIVT